MTKTFSSTSTVTIQPWVLSLGGGVAQLPLIEAAKQKGFAVCIVDQNSNCIASRHADNFIHASTHDHKTILATLAELALPIHAVLARTSGQALYTAAIIDRKFKLRGLDEYLVTLCTTKSELRKYCQTHSIPVPDGAAYDPKQPIPQLPVVIRPDFPIRGKHSVALCNLSNQIKQAINSAKSVSANGKADIATFIDGSDISLLAQVNRGNVTPIAWWEEVNQFDQANLKALGLIFPAHISPEVKQQLVEAANKFAKGFPELNYVLAFSFRVDKQLSAKLIEVHADLTGDQILDTLLPAATKRNVLSEIMSGLLGGSFPDYTKGETIPTALKFESNETKLIQSSSVPELIQLLKNDIGVQAS